VNRRIRLRPAAGLLTLWAATVTACAPRLASLPSGPGTPFADYASAFAQATEGCRGVRTMAAVLSLSGRAAGARLRAKIDAGFEAPGRVRLELPAPGKPFFTFVAQGESATLVLPRENRVLRNAPPAATLEALAGVSIGPDELRTVVTGCGFRAGQPTAGQSFNNGWAVVDLEDAKTWLHQRGGVWQLAAASRGPLEVRYEEFTSGRPATIRLRTAPGQAPAPTDLTIRLSQVDINEPLGPGTFEVEIPAAAAPLSLDELRRAGPLGR
jgi:hypothetical protein